MATLDILAQEGKQRIRVPQEPPAPSAILDILAQEGKQRIREPRALPDQPGARARQVQQERRPILVRRVIQVPRAPQGARVPRAPQALQEELAQPAPLVLEAKHPILVRRAEQVQLALLVLLVLRSIRELQETRAPRAPQGAPALQARLDRWDLTAAQVLQEPLAQQQIRAPQVHVVLLDLLDLLDPREWDVRGPQAFAVAQDQLAPKDAQELQG